MNFSFQIYLLSLISRLLKSRVTWSSQVVFCLFREKLHKHFQNTQAMERNMYWFILELNELQYTDDIGTRKLWYLSILIGYWWCNSALLSNNCFIMAFTTRQMVHESMRVETAKQVAYRSTSSLSQSLLLRRETKTNVPQRVCISILILKVQRLNLHFKLAEFWNMLCFSRY